MRRESKFLFWLTALLFLMMSLGFLTDKCQAQAYLADTVIVDSVLYSGDKLIEPDSRTLEFDQYCSCVYGDHDWCYDPDNPAPWLGERICRYCYRWERFHIEKIVKHRDTEFEILTKKAKK